MYVVLTLKSSNRKVSENDKKNHWGCYRPQTKSREGNVFRGVCLSTGGGSQSLSREGSLSGGSLCRGSMSRGFLSGRPPVR